MNEYFLEFVGILNSIPVAAPYIGAAIFILIVSFRQ